MVFRIARAVLSPVSVLLHPQVSDGTVTETHPADVVVTTASRVDRTRARG